MFLGQSNGILGDDRLSCRSVGRDEYRLAQLKMIDCVLLERV